MTKIKLYSVTSERTLRVRVFPRIFHGHARVRVRRISHGRVRVRLHAPSNRVHYLSLFIFEDLYGRRKRKKQNFRLSNH
jgi:hypothetical protein